MARNYAAEYSRRLALGAGRGESKQQARGHRTSPEQPLQALANPERFIPYLQRSGIAQQVADTPAGARALAGANDRRIKAGLAPIHLGPPPPPAPGQRQDTVDDLQEAEYRTTGIPPNYGRIYIHAGGITYQIDRRESRRKAA